ncbi:hypothetical protein COLO4_02479 [Corchorus olitorius]|uniref:Uncharacterized protein n=1 Tax=Corchorus olitorius TaxID=93759 RepID=A0A1R3L0W2_9ROSI|nr:hypothetical protein COLO4_02479 [Corchorus olitorius]
MGCYASLFTIYVFVLMEWRNTKYQPYPATPAEAEVPEWKLFMFRLLKVESNEWAKVESEAGTRT